jgi:D-sedoheptulose 7-phosphate isomerase
MNLSERGALVFSTAVAEHLRVVSSLQSQLDLLEAIARRLAETAVAGGKILWCGNGGSAADSQHLAAELVARFRRERRAIASVALTTDTSILTAIGNDYGFAGVFRRQVEALARPGDVLVGLSTSGSSENVCAALESARAMGVYTIAMTGSGGGRAGQLADASICIDSKDTARIQETHILVGHMLCDWIELHVSSAAAGHAQQASSMSGSRSGS